MKDLDSFIQELRYLHKMKEERIEDAEGLIEQTERELKRELFDMEVRVILANSGRFPEIEADLCSRARKIGEELFTQGNEYQFLQPDNPRGRELLQNAKIFEELLVLGRRRTKEGD